MGTRTCGARCHRAITPKCRCWCGGTFHGATSGLDARLAFAEQFDLEKLPTTEAAFERLTQPNLFDSKAAAWRARVDSAVASRKARKV